MKKLAITLASASALALATCGDPVDETAVEGDNVAADQMANDDTVSDAGTVVEVAQGNPDFSTLVSAITAAGLGETLSSGGPYTVFAPSNAAFDKLPDGTLEELTGGEDTSALEGILTYHVVDGETMAAALTEAISGAGDEGYTITTLGGGTLTATVVDGQVMLTDAAGNSATVTETDIDASNGVIHVIDTVLMPE